MKNIELNESVKEVKRQYFKNWREKNKDKIKGYNSKYWQKRADKIKQTNSVNE